MDLIIETDRLLLREIRLDDAEAMFCLDSNPNVHRYLGNNPVKTIDECYHYMKSIHNQYVQNGIGRFAVVLKNTNEVIGWAGLKFITEPENGHVNFYDIGYRLQEEHWRKGYAFEAAKAWLDYAFNNMKVEKVHASAHIDNIGSNKILQKIGLKLICQYNHHDLPCNWYQLENCNG